MTDTLPDRRAQLRAAIDRFLKERYDAKVDKLAPDDPVRQEAAAHYRREVWLADAARRVAQIQAVTHTLKAIHPDARGTNLFVRPDEIPARAEVGSHTLGASFATDVVGNAAALDVYRFLRVEFDGRSLLDAMLSGDEDLPAALSDDLDEAGSWVRSFAGLVDARGALATHTRAKQLFWLVGDDAADDAQFHLLAPLYSSPLAQAIHLRISEHRYGEPAQAARAARREGKDHETGYTEYRGLAMQKLGGSKPQNISQLNSERRGVNYLLASLPPTWTSRGVREPWRVDSAFPHYGRRGPVRRIVSALKAFLVSNPDPVMETRDSVDAWLDALIDHLVDFAGELHQNLAPGWSADSRCELVDEERLWLDPRRADTDETFRAQWQWMDWPAAIGRRFGNWLNGQLGDKLPVGTVEQRHWAKELLVDERWAAALDKRRREALNAQTIDAGGAA
jgi:CRISPR-associated protein Csy1